ncbi:MAG: response regulator [Candidatus Omnitrophica bacterium]|nr:response regulator [Candidatus Omnitrophota bacterium]
MSGSILIVDDEAAVTLALESFFKAKGYSVHRAFYGDQAIEQIEKDPPAVVILDLQMPGVDGIAVLNKIRQAYPHVKTMVITGHSDRYQKDLDRLKPETVHMKPVSLEDLTRGVENLLGQKTAAVSGPKKAGKLSSPVRLLFIEGTPDVYNRYLKPYFQEKKDPSYETMMASAPDQAFRLLEEFKPHLALMDGTRLPIGIDAGKLAAALGSSPARPLEVIFYSFRVSADKGQDAVEQELYRLSETLRQSAGKHHLI